MPFLPIFCVKLPLNSGVSTDFRVFLTVNRADVDLGDDFIPRLGGAVEAAVLAHQTEAGGTPLEGVF